MNAALLRAEALHVALGDTPVLHGVSLALGTGWTAIVGPNGAGKSTLLRVLAGLLAPRSGAVWLEGRPLSSWPARERGQRIAWLAQQGEAEVDLTVRDVVALGRLPHLGLFAPLGPRDERIVDEAMQATECSKWQHRRLVQLSGGERQRVLVARALAVQATTLLLDEPTTHLDPPHQVALVGLMRRLGRTQAVVSVLHDLPLALQADRLVVMQAGRICAQGAHDDTAVHASLIDVFDRAIRIQRLGERYIVLPDLEREAASSN
jgi:iron complex transport system ATP-binding protein